MLPKNSSSLRYLIKKNVERERKVAIEEANAAKEKKSRAAEEQLRAAQLRAEKRAECAARKSGATTLDEREKVKKEYAEKNRRTTTSYEYKEMVLAPNTNHYYGIGANGSKNKVGNRGAEFGGMRSASITKRWSSSSFMD